MLETLCYVYFIPLVFVVVSAVATMFSKKWSETMGLQSWNDFFKTLTGALMPVINVIFALMILDDMIPEIKLPKPKGWERS